jgi:protein-L-isoaspartate(D-aspartate) O-methyltransferase
MKDTYRHKGMRRNLVDVLKEKGISDVRILDAFMDLPRHYFLDNAFEEWAYQDKPFPIGKEQTISQPYTVAFQTQLLNVKAGEKVLEIGTGSGYQAGILGLLGANVNTIERHQDLSFNAERLLKSLGVTNVRCFFGDGYQGLPRHAPFDKILLTCGAAEMPEELCLQLKIGGQMVIPLGRGVQTMFRVTRVGDKALEREQFGDFKFVPFLKGKET